MKPEPMLVAPVSLRGEVVRLVPLSVDHLEDLSLAGQHDDIWVYLDEPTPQGAAPVAHMIKEALAEQARGERLPFAVIDQASGIAIGSISYIDIQPTHHGVEIGWAWLAPSYWRTGASRDAAYLLMRHAFDELGAIRVAFKTDSRNERSRRAILGLGATEEGVFRNHRILRDGHIRHSVYFSVVSSEWPHVRARLEKPRS